MTGGQFNVTTSPQQLYPGWQHATTIQNNGPSSVWISNDSSVNTVTSFRLRPNAVMIWEAKQPLWAVTAVLSGQFTSLFSTSPTIEGATVTVLGHALSAIDNNPIARQIYLETEPTIAYSSSQAYRRVFEASSYQSIRVELAFTRNDAEYPHPLEFRVFYFAEDKTFLSQDLYAGTILNGRDFLGSNAVSVTVPVRGAYVGIYTMPLQGSFVGNWSLDYVKVFGYTDKLPIEITTQRRAAAASALNGVGLVVTDDGANLFDVTMASRRCVSFGTDRAAWLPGLGEQLTIYAFASSVISAVNIYLVDPNFVQLWASPVITVAGEYLFVANVPNTSSLRLVTSNPAVFFDFRISWQKANGE